MAPPAGGDRVEETALSESDSFIQEVTEEVRQDRMFALWKKWGAYVLAGLVLIVGAAAFWSWNQAQERARAEDRGAALLAPDADPEALVGSLEPPAEIVAEFAAAARLGRSGEMTEAARRYRGISARNDIAEHYRQLALLQAVRLEAAALESGADPSAALAELAPLIEGSPYALLARELAAALHLRAGDREAAHAELQAILADPAATSSLRLRAQEMLTASGGELPAQTTTSAG
jgi:hypothetical protein